MPNIRKPPLIDLPSLGIFLDSLEEGVLFLDHDRRIVVVNEAAERMVSVGFNDAILDQLCPSVFASTPCAGNCQAQGRCVLAPQPGADRMVQDIELEGPGATPLYLRMWAMLLPADNPLFHCAIILRDRSHEVSLEKQMRERLRLGGMVGHSPAMQQLYEQILRAAASDATVLVSGESGTGKELVARALHDNSARAAGPYVPVHCAALPEALLESELFGHAKGAFTGATAARAGRFEAAGGGTLLLDEIGEITPGTQVKLLRVLQEREIVRLGENHARPVDVRVIAATHRDLAAMVARGEFREDLYYRLRVLPLNVPPLRERKEDIAQLANKLLDGLREQYKRARLSLAHETLLALERHDWPGNVRQLSNALEYAVVHADGAEILPQHLPPEVTVNPAESSSIRADRTDTAEPPLVRRYYRAAHASAETERILRMLEECGGNRSEAAQRLGMSRTTLWKKLKQAGLDGDASS